MGDLLLPGWVCLLQQLRLHTSGPVADHTASFCDVC